MSHTRYKWFEKMYVYAALAATPSVSDAQALLADKGITLSQRQLACCRQQGAHLIAKALEQQLPQRLYGTVNLELPGRLEKLAEHIEEHLNRTTWENKTDVDLVDKYLKLIDLLMAVSAGENDESETEQAGRGASAQAESGGTGVRPALEDILTRFEEANDQATIRDAMRRAAAATGSALPEAGAS